MLVKMKIRSLIKLSQFDRSQRKINTCNIKTHLGQCLTMAPFSASHIQHSTPGFGFQVANQGMNKLKGFFLISVLVQQVIVM